MMARISKIAASFFVFATVLTAAEKPNIVLIFCDDLGYGDIGCFGAKGWKTPNIDRIAKEGGKYTEFYVAQPVCSASRTALLTGCYPNRLGITGALGPNSQIGINENETTLAEICKSAGYATAAYGKWHLGHLKHFLPVHHGFDDYLGYPYSNDMWPSGPVIFKENQPLLPLIEDDETVVHVREQHWMTTWLTERSVDFIRENKEKPFFLYLAHPQPHVPLFVSPERAGKTDSLLGDVIQEIDWSTGEILAELEKQGLADNTWVIFTSDNGPWMVYGNHAGDTGGLRGSKGNNWEGGVRVPCVMRWPGKIPPGSEIATPFMTIDLLPTIAGVLGLDLPALPIDGKDALAVITGKQKEPVQEAYFFYYKQNDLEAMRMGKWKLQFPHSWREEKLNPGQDGMPGKYTFPNVGLELFDLEKDRDETTDVAAEFPAIIKKMQALADQKRADLGDNLRKIQGTGRREPGRAIKQK